MRIEPFIWDKANMADPAVRHYLFGIKLIKADSQKVFSCRIDEDSPQEAIAKMKVVLEDALADTKI